MKVIRQRLEHVEPNRKHVPLHVDRLTLGKSRWRGKADDGTDFGFDLDRALAHGQPFYSDAEHVYIIDQRPEPVLEIALGEERDKVALLAWSVGNLHQPIQILPDRVRIADDPALHTLLAQLKLEGKNVEAVFQPQKASTIHHHHH